MDFYIVSVNHTNREHRYITFWRPDNAGYAWPLSWAGRYSEKAVRESLDYYNCGGNVAVPCHLIDPIAVAPVKGYIDKDAGPVIENNRANWDLILSNVIEKPERSPRPEFKGARKQPIKTKG